MDKTRQVPSSSALSRYYASITTKKAPNKNTANIWSSIEDSKILSLLEQILHLIKAIMAEKVLFSFSSSFFSLLSSLFIMGFFFDNQSYLFFQNKIVFFVLFQNVFNKTFVKNHKTVQKNFVLSSYVFCFFCLFQK